MQPNDWRNCPGLRILGPSGERGALVGFVMDAAHPHDLTTFADQHGSGDARRASLQSAAHAKIRRAGNNRASFYFYNTNEEIDRMIEILRDAVAFFRMNSELEELYQEVILDHSRRPRNFGELPDATVRVHGDNPACGDEIHLAVKFDADGRVGGHQVHRARVRDQPGVGVIDDDEIERQKPRGSDGDACAHFTIL